MRYHYREQVKRKKPRSKKKLLIVPAVMLIAGAYGASTIFSPLFIAMPGAGDTLRQKLETTPEKDAKRLYIPKIGISETIIPGGTSDSLEGVWHLNPNSSSPKKGDSFAICAESFSIGWNPIQTKQQSPFYNLGKLAVGDQIFVDYQGERYGYEVEERLAGVPGQVEAADTKAKDGGNSSKPNLMLYPCTPDGVNKGGNVFIAKSLGEVEELTLGRN